MQSIKLIIAAVLVMVGMSVMGQTTDFHHDGTNLYYNGGSVGLGTNLPLSTFMVTSNETIEPSIIIHCPSTNRGGATYQMIDELNNQHWKFKAFNNGFKIRDQQFRKDIFIIEQNSLANAFYITSSGNIGIGGITTPRTALDVNGTVSCNSILVDGKLTSKEVEVKMDVWPDYVFEENYNLLSLDELDCFIKENKHLPGVPTENEIVNDGLSVGEMNKVLMEKVEELTLYVIQLQKQINSLK